MRKFVSGILVGLILGLGVGAIVAQPFIRWQKSEVLPIVIVEPLLGRFKPKDGSSLQGNWSKDEVTPMCLVKPVIGGFVPLEGPSIGYKWTKDEVKPFVPVKYSVGGFAPAE